MRMVKRKYATTVPKDEVKQQRAKMPERKRENSIRNHFMVRMVKRKHATTVPKDEADNKEPKCQNESG